MSRYDAAAPTYDAHRGLPRPVVEAVRAAVLGALAPSRPRLLDLGAGSGRIGRAFVAAGDDYVGVDLSFGMLHQFARRGDTDGRVPRLLRADGERLPFADAAFDAVLLIQVFGGLDEWRPFLAEARRVLRSRGALVLGRTAMPEDGVDARMKERLDAILADLAAAHERTNAREHVQRWLGSTARGGVPTVAAAWEAERSPRGFLERHRTGARFSLLPEPVKDEAMRRLSAWAAREFGSLDAPSTERHAFELRTFAFEEEVPR
ncbi:MAG TPA: class I SAM-dependent methyltransferase [Candidatus Acidoferrum sp.]|nr:class I SAM-dependent methyltransferase [Candidatus Acidoferrum sp.]